MKKVYQSLLAFLMLAIVCPAFAQDSDERMQLKSKASDNWFISIGGAGSLLQGEQDSEKSIGDRLRLGGEFSVGKWFNPDFGMRLQLTGGSLRGFNFLENQGGEYTREDRSRDQYPTGYYDGSLNLTSVSGGEGFWQDFNYGAVTIDLMANLTNLFRGYYKDAPVEIIPFAGLGLIYGFESDTNPKNYGLLGKLGLRANFNINNKWSIFLEPQINMTSEEFDGYEGDRGFDMVANAMIGVQFNINRDFSTIDMLSRQEIDAINNKLNQQRNLIENHQYILERQQNLLEKLENCCDEKDPLVIKETESYVPEYVRFGLNSHKIDQIEFQKIEEAAAHLKSHPNSKILIIGYADKKTGNASYNYKLSQKRTEAVAENLKRLGIASDRIIMKWLGDKEQPYDTNEWNRVVIMVERK